MFFRLFVLLTIVLAIFAQKDYTEVVKFLKAKIEDKNGVFYHSAYNRLAYIVDTYGSRLYGSQALQMVINEMLKQSYKEGFENIRLQPVRNFTKWVRGKEQLILRSPRPFPTKLNLIGLGRSASGYVTADAIVFRSFDQLEARKDQIAGKIVVYNQPWTNYYDTYIYRKTGAERAKKYGAVASLVRSIASSSIYSVHAGCQGKNSDNTIPAAAITVQDAEMFQRMQDRGQRINLELTLQSQQVPGANSYNLIFEIKGSTKPDQILLIGGHIDSWDTGSQTGANDDGGGFITCFQSMRLLFKNGLRPQRTIRFIAWTGQEFNDPNDNIGSLAYMRTHLKELDKHIVAFQDDYGSTKFLGFGITGEPQAKAIVDMIASKYMVLLNASQTSNDGEAVDTEPLYEKGVPMMKNLVEDTQNLDNYFRSHHTGGDSMSVMNADDLDSNVLGIAVMFYILADLDHTIPRIPNSMNLSTN